MYQSYHLSHKDARKMIEMIEQNLERTGRKACVAVTDAQGELLGFLRTDGARVNCITIAINKAFSAAREQKPSGEIGETARREGWPMSNFGDIRYTAWQGGVPVVYKGQVVGAVGVSGLTGEEDLELSRMAADLIT